MSELKPCPFCGGKAALRMFWMEDGHRYRAVECVECGATTPGNYSEVGDQSAWDWNSRAERTCKIIEWYEARDRHEIGNNRVRFSCGDFGTCHDKFCSECGAKVVRK